MEADDFRSQLPNDVAHFRTKRRAGACGKCGRVHTKLGIVGSEPFEPRSFQLGIPLRDMAEEIQIKRFGGLSTDFPNHIAHLRRCQRGAWKRAKPARVGHSYRHIRTGVESHWRLDNGMIDLDRKSVV